MSEDVISELIPALMRFVEWDEYCRANADSGLTESQLRAVAVEMGRKAAARVHDIVRGETTGAALDKLLEVWPDADSNQIAIGPVGGGVAVADVVCTNAIGISTAGTRATGRANAAKLVKAWNNLGPLHEALGQAIEQLQADYVHTPLDGHGALLRKLREAYKQGVMSKREASLQPKEKAP